MSDVALRSDAQRNIERVLDTALRILGENPAATVEQVAAASGVHRSTVYRRFPTRETLVRALLERALAEASALVEDVSSRPADELALRQLCAEMMAFGTRYAFLDSQYRITELGSDPVGLGKLMRRYQRAGVVRSDLPAIWIASAFTSLAVALIEDHEPSTSGMATAAGRLADTFLDGVRAR